MTPPVKPNFSEVDEVEKNFLEVLELVALGREIVITRNSQPIAKLSPIVHTDPESHLPRKSGGAEGLEIPKSFFDPLPDDVTKYFE